MWIEHYEFDELKRGKAIKVKLLNYDIKINDTIHVKSCYKDEDELDVKVIQIINNFCDECDMIIIQKNNNETCNPQKTSS